MGLLAHQRDEYALWQIRLAGGSACPTLAPVGQALRFRLPTGVFNGRCRSA